MDNHLSPNFLETASDELQRLALEEALKRHLIEREVRVMVFPAGKSDLPFELAQHGITVTALDDPEWKSACLKRISKGKFGERVSFVPGNLGSLDQEFTDEPFDLIVCRRGLCSLPYAEAMSAIRALLRKLRIGGKLYISVLGIHSELGDGYAGIDVPVRDRYFTLSPTIAKKYGIDNPVCLYGERDIFLLLLEAGASVLRTFTSTHGSVKAVAGRV